MNGIGFCFRKVINNGDFVVAGIVILVSHFVPIFAFPFGSKLPPSNLKLIGTTGNGEINVFSLRYVPSASAVVKDSYFT